MSYYQDNAKHYYAETVALHSVSRVRKSFLSYLDKNSHILDLGCGSGRDSLYFKQHGYIVTALDASEEIAKLASTLISQQVVVGSFQSMDYVDSFDAVWACASLLHCPKQEIHNVFESIIRALKQKGIWYMSFKYGLDENIDSMGRFFNNYTSSGLENLVKQYDMITILDSWVESSDLRGRQQKWVNMIVQKGVK